MFYLVTRIESSTWTMFLLTPEYYRWYGEYTLQSVDMTVTVEMQGIGRLITTFTSSLLLGSKLW